MNSINYQVLREAAQNYQSMLRGMRLSRMAQTLRLIVMKLCCV